MVSESTAATVTELVALVDRVGSLRTVLETLRHVLPSGLFSSDALEMLLAPMQSADTSADCANVCSFLRSADALQGGLNFASHVSTHPLVSMDLAAELERCSQLIQEPACEGSLQWCSCSGSSLLPARHTARVCSLLDQCTRYVNELLVPMVDFLDNDVRRVFERAAEWWQRRYGVRGSTERWSTPAEAVHGVATAMQEWAAAQDEIVHKVIAAFVAAADRLGGSLSSLGNIASNGGREDSHPLQQTYGICMQSCVHLEKLFERLLPSTSGTTTTMPREAVSKGYYKATLHDSNSASSGGLGSLAVAVLGYLRGRLDAELEFVRASLSMATSVAAQLCDKEGLLMSITQLVDEETKQRFCIAATCAASNRNMMDSLSSLRENTSLTSPPPVAPPSCDGAHRPAWWEDASSDDDADDPCCLTTASHPVNTPAVDSVGRTASLSLCDQLCATLAKLCRQRLQMSASLHGECDPAVGKIRRESIVRALLHSWRGEAVRAAIHHIAHSQAQRSFRAASVDMKELLCELLDAWAHHLHTYMDRHDSVEVHSAQLEQHDASLLCSGEQAMRDVALVVHLLLPRCRVSMVPETPMEISHGAADAVILTCPLPEEIADEESTPSKDFWCDVFDVLWFQVDPLGAASGGYLFPVAPRGEGIAQHANHSFGFLNLTNVTLIMSSPVQLQLRYSTRMTTVRSNCTKEGTPLYGCTLDSYMRNARLGAARQQPSQTAINWNADGRLALLRRVIYSFAKLEKHQLLLPAEEGASQGFACPLDELSVLPMTETIVAWFKPASAQPQSTPAELLSLGFVPPHALALVRRGRIRSPRAVSHPPSHSIMQQSVIAQLALVVQRISRLVSPPIVLLADTSTVLLDSILSGEGIAGSTQYPGGSLTVAAFLCFFDDVVASLAAPAPKTVGTYLHEVSSCVDVEQQEALESPAAVQHCSQRSFSVQTTTMDSLPPLEGGNVESYQFFRQTTQTPTAPSLYQDVHDGVQLLALKASKRTWNTGGDGVNGSPYLPELSSKTCSAQSSQIVIRPTNNPNADAGEDVLRGVPDVRDASPTLMVDLVALPDSLSAPFMAFAQQLSVATERKRPSSPSVQRHGSSPMRPLARPLEIFALTARVQVPCSVVEGAAVASADVKLRDAALMVGKRLKLPAALPSSGVPVDVVVFKLPETVRDISDVLPGVQLPFVLGTPAPGCKSPKTPVGKENCGIARKLQRWSLISKRTTTAGAIENEVLFVVRVR